MQKHLTILNVGITLYCAYCLVRILFSDGGPWAWGYMVIWVFSVIWFIGILTDQFLKSIIKEKLTLNITGAIILGLFFFIIFK